MKAVKFYKAKDFRVEEVTTPEVKAGHVIIDVEWVGICGSDIHEYVAGPLNAYPEIIMGHEFSGIVSEVGEGVTNVKVGDRVACENLDVCDDCKFCKSGRRHLCEQFAINGYGLYGFSNNGAFAEKVLLKATNAIKIPDNLSMEHAAMVEPGAVCYHAVNQTQLTEGSTAAIFGAGPIGLLTIIMAKAKKASQIIVVDIAEDRLELAKKLGATTVINPINEDAVTKIKELSKGGVDVAFEVAGVQATFASATQCIGKAGEVNIVALYEKEVNLAPMTLSVNEAKISTAWCYSEEFQPVIDIYSSNIVDLDLLITKKIFLDNLVSEGFETLTTDKSHIKILVTPKKENL
ncbi:MAG: 2,3-butanediol dehydrogenase [Lactovum sp.]